MDRINKYKYPGAKRLMLEAQELKDNTEDYWAEPIEDNLFEWHFTVRGPPDSVFDGGYYHGRISFPTDYPMKPPSIILLTPNGRFETNKKICLSISGYHPETWQPSWSIRTALLALIAFMPTKANGAIGSLDQPDFERRRLAKKSHTWKCDKCGLIKDLLVQPQKKSPNNNSTDTSDRIHTASTSDSTASATQNGFVKCSAATQTEANEAKEKVDENSLESSGSCKRITPNGEKAELVDPQNTHNDSSPATNCTDRGKALQNQGKSGSSTTNQKEDQPSISAAPPEQITNSYVVSQSISNQRSYSMIIFGMAAVLILLILRRIFFVAL